MMCFGRQSGFASATGAAVTQLIASSVVYESQGGRALTTLRPATAAVA